MPSSMFTTIIGTTAFIFILLAVVGYTGFRTLTLMRESEVKAYEKISASIAYQILLVMAVKSNNSALLNYPVEGAHDRLYEVAVGNGTTLMSRYRFVTGLLDNYTYVLVVDPVSTTYGFTPLFENSTTAPVVIVEAQSLGAGEKSCSHDGFILFTSNSAVLIEKNVASNKILLTCKFKGVKTR